MGKSKVSTSTKPKGSKTSALSKKGLKYEYKKGKFQLSPGFNPKYPGGYRDFPGSVFVRGLILQLRGAINRGIAFLKREFREW